jgi:hypothetical protein
MMRDDGLPRDIAPVEARLRAAADDASWPATPDLRGRLVGRLESPAPDLRPGVLARIGAAPQAAPPGRHGRLRAFPLAATLALVAVVAAAGIAGALGFRLPGFELSRTTATPAAGAGFDLGSPVPLADVLDASPPALRLPEVLPAPDTAWVLGAGDRRLVTVAWRPADGEPALATSDLALTLTAVAGRTEEALIRKVAGPGTTVEAVRVGDDAGWWIAGERHEVLVTRPDGTIGMLPAALAGDTLVFSRDGTLYRIESALGRDRTLAIAASMP